ncbi:MAG: ABC transporter ATP-binding protein/permease [Candidatus Obscuribacterales bacterium]|nr:ABC transporter ATP-binding protein/permease [Candidatus Obscuribacterales bacterium]
MKPVSTRRKAGYTFFDVFKFAARYWRMQPWRLSIILALLAVSTFIETNLPGALSAFIENIRVHSSAEKIWSALAVFLSAYFAYTLLYNLMARVYNVFENNVFNKLLNDSFEHIESLSEQYFVNTFTGSMITTIKRGRDRIETFEDVVLIDLYMTSLVLISSVTLLSFRMPTLALVLTVYLILLIGVSLLLVLKYAGPAQEAFANAQDRFGAHLADSITGIVTTKSYAQEHMEIARFVDETKSLREFNLQAYLRGNTTVLIQRLLMGGLFAILMCGGTWYYLEGRATIDDMAYLVLAYTIMLSYVRNVGEHVKRLLTASYDLHAIIALMREKPAVADRSDAKELTVSRGEICFQNVTFTYPNKPAPVFENLSIRIEPGERIALVGDSGGGKTTFVRLIQRLYDVQEGSITIDGEVLTDVTQQSLRSSIAVVPQDPILFHRSIRDNIAYGRPNSSLDEIRAAAKQANIDEFVMGLPARYDTLVGERGIKLSGGERQRVAIARAILADRKILILDEATSSLDSVSERAIQSAIHTVTHGRTSIMIAHRLSTIRDADRILVFHNGRIVEEGTHDDLTEKPGGIYATFFAIQSDGFLVESKA